MQFSDSANKTGIVEEIDFIVGSDSTEYPTVQKTRNINRWYDRVVSLILQADSKWNWDDSNYTDLPIGTLSLVANQQTYSISGNELLKLLRVECKNSSGDWVVLTQIDPREMKGTAMDEFLSVAGNPQFFDIVNNTFTLYPKPNYSSTNGFKVYYQRIPDYFTSADTTQVPGFAEPFHRILSYGAALDFCIAKNMAGRIGILREEIAKLEAGIITHYAERNKDIKPRITLAKEDYGVGEMEQESVDWSS